MDRREALMIYLGDIFPEAKSEDLEALAEVFSLAFDSGYDFVDPE